MGCFLLLLKNKQYLCLDEGTLWPFCLHDVRCIVSMWTECWHSVLYCVNGVLFWLPKYRGKYNYMYVVTIVIMCRKRSFITSHIETGTIDLFTRVSVHVQIRNNSVCKKEYQSTVIYHHSSLTLLVYILHYWHELHDYYLHSNVPL